MLVSTDWLARHQDDKHLVIIDMASDYTQYQRFHINKAVFLGYNQIVQRRKKDGVSVAIPKTQLIQLLGQLGVSERTHVVIYDDMGGLNAGRLFWELERLGHQHVSVLDGGLVKWILEHRKVNNKIIKPVRTAYTPPSKPIKNNNIANVKDVLALVNKKMSGVLLDARSPEEYFGSPKHLRSGHIPGAKLFPWTENVDFEKEFKLKPAPSLMQLYEGMDINKKQKNIIAYCQSGHRASQTYLTLRSLGFEDVKIYDGSMAEYSRIKAAPISQGNAP